MHLTRSQTLALVEILKVNLMLSAKLVFSVMEKAKLEYILTKYQDFNNHFEYRLIVSFTCNHKGASLPKFTAAAANLMLVREVNPPVNPPVPAPLASATAEGGFGDHHDDKGTLGNGRDKSVGCDR